MSDKLRDLVNQKVKVFGKTIRVKWIEYDNETRELNINDKIKLTGSLEDCLKKLRQV